MIISTDHLIIISSRNVDFEYTIMIDESIYDNPDIKNHWYTDTIYDFVRYVARKFEWVDDDLVRIIQCHEGHIVTNAVRVKN